MTSPGDAPPVKPAPSFAPGLTRVASQRRSSSQHESPPLLNSNPAESTPALPTATSELPIRSASPHTRPLRSSTPQLARSALTSPLDGRLDGSDDLRSIIIRAFSPAIWVYASEDTDELAREKGFKRGFWELIRPFGETVPGKIVIRDSVGSSQGWEDYGVRFVDLAGRNWDTSAAAGHDSPGQVEEVLARQLSMIFADDPLRGPLRSKRSANYPTTSPLYKLFLRQLLSAASVTPHETFRHPVASVIAISSRNANPLETLRQLYADTSNGHRRLPEWVHPDYLRYYVLVHDEDRDDITESTKLFDQMKRHFGLHCHLLRVRSSQCVVTDDDSVQTPSCEWLSPSETLMGSREVDVDAGGPPCLFDSDVMAIKAFVRELVAQSVIPFMENRIAIWNDQVASRRRGISGRFMSMSRRWAGFGSGSRSGLTGSGSGSSGNYDANLGFYRPDTPEAVLRKLGDFAFMLRDWKLAGNTYELLRADYGNDKAWRYHAGTHEMCAVSTLLNPLTMPAKVKLEAIEQLIDTACYSYLTRCSDATNTLRCLTLVSELLKSRGGAATEAAARWAMRAMDIGLVGPVESILFSERISSCYAARTASSGTRWGSRRRKAGMWSILAADRWLKMGKPALASTCLEEAEQFYAGILETEGVFPMPEMQAFVDGLRHAVRVEYLEAKGIDSGDAQADTETPVETEETSEKLDKRSHRKSLMGLPAPLDPGGLSSPQASRETEDQDNDDFERA